MIIFYQDPIFGSMYEIVENPKKDFSKKNRNQKRINASNKNSWNKKSR
jgi:hypothetical protein